MLDFKLVAEALRERELLLHTTAPHLVKPVPFIYPLLHRIWERPFTTSGIGLYDALAILGSKVHSMPIHKHYTRKGIQKIFPDVNPQALIGGIKYYDAKVDDSRLVVNIIRTAVNLGAYAANRTQVTKVNHENGKICSAQILDLETNTKYTVQTDKIINATGVWTEKTQNLCPVDPTQGLKVLASKGVHIVVPRQRIQGEAGFILQTEKSVLFIIPWKRYWIIGTTDTKYEEDLRNPCASKEDIDYIIEHANVILKNPISRDDIIGVYAGLRPLLQPVTKNDSETKSTKVSREHTVTELYPGFISIAGGKLTTYRVMAEDAVDFALGKEQAGIRPSLTTTTPLLGAQYYKVYKRQRKQIAQEYALPLSCVEDLLDRYGDNIKTILELIDQNPELATPINGAESYIQAEIVFACLHEGVLHLEDVMLNRTRIVYEYADRGLSAVEEIAKIMAKHLQWDTQTVEKEIKIYRDRCKAEEKASNTLLEKDAQQVRALAEEITQML